MVRRSSGGGGGILGSGIFGFFGTTIQCDSKDDSTYCNIMKIFNLLISKTNFYIFDKNHKTQEMSKENPYLFFYHVRQQILQNPFCFFLD